jgi:LCP family protein required for cell wall assembly
VGESVSDGSHNGWMAASGPASQSRAFARRRPSGWAGYAATCIAAALILVGSGFAYNTVSALQSIGSSNAIVSGPSIGAQNILLMGLESRRYWNGQILPSYILKKLHSGNAQAVANGTGGNATNTLILIHIPAGGKKAVGFSIPRDDWVKFAGTIGAQQQGKIDQAYGVSMFYREQQLAAHDQGISQDQLAILGNEAGQAAAVATVEKLTGVHIDHFAVVNLYGFYELARVLGGVQVCLKHAVHDVKSGARFHAGYQHLNASQALSFVRQRDGLPNGDLDRTHRQQAFLDSVLHQLRSEGLFSDVAKIHALLSVAQHYVITDSGWNLLDFAEQMHSLTAGNLTFRTLPIVRYQVIDGQDANVVNPAYIKALVHEVFYGHPSSSQRPRTAAAKATVDVLNGGYTAGLARRISMALAHHGYRPGKVGNTATRATTVVSYGPGAAAAAAQVARLFGVTATASSSVRAGRVVVMLGTSATMPAALAVGQPSPGLSSGASPSVTPPSTGPQGGAVSGGKNGVPCVN